MQKNLLQKHFPLLRSLEEVKSIIQQNPVLHNEFQRWKPVQQQEFLDFCTGERGVKILYDSFFKEIFNPEYAPQRLEEFLSAIMNQSVKILKVLPNDSTRISDETSLLITDIIVELEDHSIANVEIQKWGYLFPGQRSACYAADMLLRQYKRLRDELKKKFTYHRLQNVYSIILFEHSTKEFHAFPDHHLHYFSQKSDTGLELSLLQQYYFIPLDIFYKNIHNKGIKTNLDAWLTFLTTDDPEMILNLIRDFPEFENMYKDIYEFCRNIEGVMDMFSKELLELDRNTVKYMIDEMQNELLDRKQELDDTKQELDDTKHELDDTKQELDDAKQELDDAKLQLALTTLLIHDDRTDDLKKALSDIAFRKKLYNEYSL